MAIDREPMDIKPDPRECPNAYQGRVAPFIWEPDTEVNFRCDKCDAIHWRNLARGTVGD